MKHTHMQAFVRLISFSDALKLIMVPFLKWESSQMLSIYKEVPFFNTSSRNLALVFSNQRRKMINRI